MSYVSELSVGSLLIYPKGPSDESIAARSFIRYEIKLGRAARIEYSVRRLREASLGSPLEGFFPGDETLVPVPGHAPRVEGGLWVAERICRALVAQGVGWEVAAVLERIELVPRSSGASSAAERPDPKAHHRSLAAAGLLEQPPRIVLVDDVVTRGSTLIGCATRLVQTFPRANLRAFGLARVEPVDLQEKGAMLSPKVETIRYDEVSGVLERA